MANSAQVTPCVCLCVRLLAEKNLPAAIEDTGGNEVPESIREKAEAVRNLGGLEVLQKKLYDLPEHLQRNRDILTEVRWAGPRVIKIIRECDSVRCMFGLKSFHPISVYLGGGAKVVVVFPEISLEANLPV